MTPIELDIPDIDWPLLRQALSLALLGNRTTAIRGGARFLAAAPEYGPLYRDLARAASLMNAGRLHAEGETLIYEPERIHPGNYPIESGPLSSAVEIALFLMPALFHGDFRTILELRGVTHSVLSYPTAFIKETLLARLERMGFYASLTLRRFGFHGSGGGSAEARVYPREAAVAPADGEGPIRISGAKIFIARLDRELALREKRALAGGLGLDEGRIAVIEVLDADGYGNSIQVFTERAGLAMAHFREMNFFSVSGDVQFSEEDFNREIDGLIGEVRRTETAGILPPHIARELYPYGVLSGPVPSRNGEDPALAGIRYVCGKLL